MNPTRVRDLKNELLRASDHAKALAVESRDSSLGAFYALIGEVTALLVQRCPGFTQLIPGLDEAALLEQQEGAAAAPRPAEPLPPEA